MEVYNLVTWEYKTESTTKSIFTGKNKEDINEMLNTYGREGWELVTIVPETMGGTISGYTYFFKRKRF
jgi:hypothetical protein